MRGIGDNEYVALRFGAFAEEVLAPAVHPIRAPLDLAVHQTSAPISHEAAAGASFEPVSTGFRWGPVWSTAWFRAQGTVPADMAGRPVALRFSSGTEALLWQGGVPRQGLDDNHDTCLLLPCAAGGESITCLIEAACNMPLGISTFWWDHPEVHKRWREDKPGRVEACELVAVDPDMWQVLQMYELARKLALALPENSPRARELVHGLREITNGIPAIEPREAALASKEHLATLLRGRASAPPTTCVAVGHAHMDTAWLWSMRETRRKLLRTWSSTIDLMERQARFHFIATQAQQYAWVEQDAPALFEKIRKSVEEGRWEPGGGMWVEADCNCPSGESLVRQIVHGSRYWRERFGSNAPQSHLFLPDTFGFPASLPQIMKLSGLETFITTKMSWCEHNDMPHVTFLWRGIDGTEVLSHLTPGDNYNAPLEPEDLLRGENQVLRKDWQTVGPQRKLPSRWLQPYGYGDGGGGPTAEMIARAELAADAEGLPRVEQGRMADFCAALRAECRSVDERDPHGLPVWDGELYMEAHRGTLTSQAWLKQANARAERQLRVVEAMFASLPESAAPTNLQSRLDAIWKTVLLHQFHDVLPGTSIGIVYEEAREAYAQVDESMRALMEDAATALSRATQADGDTSSLLVFNPSSHTRSGVVCRGDERIWIDSIPPLATTVVSASSARDSVRVTERSLENSHLRLVLDDAGRIASLHQTGCEEPANADAPGGDLRPLNQLVAYEDRPRRWEAWNIDLDYADKPALLDAPAESISVTEQGSLRAAIEVRHEFRASSIVQRYVLDAHSPRVDILTTVDWHEEKTLLRALFPTRVRARNATYGIQFGHLERPTHANTSWEEARFEVAGHRWMDLSQPGLGLALLDRAQYGRSCHEGCIGLSLLRAPRFPDPQADLGEHELRYALIPHAGDWRAAGVPAQADEVADPFVILPHRATSGGQTPVLLPLDLRAAAEGSVEIAAFKAAADGRGRILRLVERHGGLTSLRLGWPDAETRVLPVDLLEQPLDRQLEHDAAARETRVTLRPFEILTLRVLSGASDAT